MSASLLNAATLPGAASGQPGAAQGIAQQAANAAQTQGPLAGFEALLAAFFGDQGTATPGTAAGVAVQGPFALLAGQGQPGAKTTDGKTAKTAGAADAGKTDGKAADGATPATAASDGAVDASILALLSPGTVPAQAQTQIQAQATAGGGDAAPADAGLDGKPAAQTAAAQLAFQLPGADGKAAKAAAFLAAQAAQASTGQVATPDDGKAAPAATPAPGKAQAAPAATLTAPALTNQTAAVTTQTLPPPVQAATAPTKGAETAAANPGAAKDKGGEIKTARVEGAPTGPTPTGSAVKTELAQATAAAAGGAGKDADAEARDSGQGPEAKPAPASDAGQPAQSFSNALNTQAANNPAALAHAASLVRGSPQTVANLAAQIAKKLDGRSTRFDVQLDPAGLGKVDVRVEIDAAGKMTAALNFDNQQAASELKSRAGELQRAMEQAGFDLSGGLSFDVSGQGGQQAQGQGGDASPSFRGRAFQAVLEGGADSAVNPQTAYRQTSASGVDIRI